MYSDKKIEFSNNQDTCKKVWFNDGIITIDTSNLSIRFRYTGTTGSGGFAPYVQRTFYFKNLISFDWESDNNNKDEIKLKLISSYDIRNETTLPIVEIEGISGFLESEDKRSGPDYSIVRYSIFVLLFDKNNFSIKDIGRLSIWLNALRN